MVLCGDGTYEWRAWGALLVCADGAFFTESAIAIWYPFDSIGLMVGYHGIRNHIFHLMINCLGCASYVFPGVGDNYRLRSAMVRYSLGEGKDGRPGGEGDKVTETRDEARQCGD